MGFLVLDMTGIDTPSVWDVISGLGMIAVGAAAVAWWRRRGVARFWFSIGAVTWTASVALKLGWAIVSNGVVERALVGLLGPAAGAMAFWLYIGLITGLFECGLTWLVASRTQIARAEWDQSVGFGVGFGAVEAALIGIALIAWALVSPSAGAAPASGGPAAMASHGIAFVLPVVERAATLVVHVYTCVLVIDAVRRQRRRSFWCAFAFKAGLDAIAAAAILGFKVPDSLARWIVFEAIVVLFAVAAWLGLGRLYARR
jgi:hypothetical protein